MKIGVISDTHIPDKYKEIPKKVLEGLRGVDMIIHAGDLVNLKVLEALKKICPDVKAVAGNMDHEEVKRKLPQKKIIKAGKFKIGVMHGIGAPSQLVSSLREAFKKDDVDIVIFGHSHNSVNEIRDGVLFFNPGSITDEVFAEFNSYGIIELNDKIDARIIRI